MATTTNILSLLKFFSSKQKSGVVELSEFITYLRKYAEHHIVEQPSLQVYIEDANGALQPEIEKLAEQKLITVSETNMGKIVITVIPYYIDAFAERYRDIKKNPALPFPTVADLPKLAPKTIIKNENALDLIHRFLEKQDLNEKTLHGVLLPNDEPVIILPSNVPVRDLIESSLEKVQYMLRKESFHDYFLKKLTGTNPGKELTAKNFFNSFVDRPDHGMEILAQTSEDFYYWHQLCYFIKQDYKKVKDYTQEDISTIQAIIITEIAANYFKTQAMDDSRRENAFKMLDQFLNHPPYYFSYEAITEIKDAKGSRLLGQYTEAELKEWLHEKSTNGAERELPDLLVFKIESGERYFIYKNHVLQLVIRLCTDARQSVRDGIAKHWFKVLQDFEKLPEMTDQAKFEERLKSELREQSPVLYALLTASFLPLLTYEKFGDDDGGTVTLFVNGELIPYSELLLMNRAELLSDAKIKLPFWYTIPIFSWIAKLIFQPPKSKRGKKPKSTADEYREKEAKKAAEDEKIASMAGKHSNVGKKTSLREAARNAEKKFVPATSTLDQELESYERMWNNLIEKQHHENLTADVNALIRDYMRGQFRNLSPSGLTPDRINSMASTIAKLPGMMKIKAHAELQHYIQLYILKLVKNLPNAR